MKNTINTHPRTPISSPASRRASPESNYRTFINHTEEEKMEAQ